MNKIVIELCAEDRQRLDELIGFAALLAGSMQPRELCGHPDPVGEPGPAGVPAPAEEHPADASTAHLEPPVKPVSLGEFQKAIVTRCAESAAMKQKVQALVHKYADSVSGIPEDKRPEVLAALATL